MDGASDATTMFLAGETDFLSANVGDVMEAEENGYKPIVVFADERSKYMPDVPTAKETGVDDYVSFSARGYAYMKGVDQAIVDRMTQALEDAFEDPDYQKNLRRSGSEAWSSASTPPSTATGTRSAASTAGSRSRRFREYAASIPGLLPRR